MSFNSTPRVIGRGPRRASALCALVSLLLAISGTATAQKPVHAADSTRHDSTHMDMPGMTMPSTPDTAAHDGTNAARAMSGEPLAMPMERTGSGTSWLPDASPMYASHVTLGGWDLMLHGVAFAQLDAQSSERGDRQLNSVNWGMIMGGHDLAGGRIHLRTMVSAEPLTVGSRGYPLLLQSGETYRGQSLHDRQHPHDLFMELSAIYDREIAPGVAMQLYVAPAGEPAIGPVAFPHRPSAANNPLAPIGHHWQDATHISFGVVTAALYTRTVKVEGSIFNGREPDEIRTNLDYHGRRLDSYAGRVTINLNPHVSLSGSYAYLDSPEALDPDESMRRISASILYGNALGATGNWSGAIVYGANETTSESRLSQSVLGEANFELDAHNTLFGRAEAVTKSRADLAVPVIATTPPSLGLGRALLASAPDRFDVGELTAGYVREIASVASGSLGLGVASTVNIVPASIESLYGSRFPLGATLFVRIRPGRMHGMPMSMRMP